MQYSTDTGGNFWNLVPTSVVAGDPAPEDGRILEDTSARGVGGIEDGTISGIDEESTVVESGTGVDI